MIFQETPRKGARSIDPEPLTDKRGLFARAWSRPKFEAHALFPGRAQCNILFNRKKGTLRGMHCQIVLQVEARLGRCTAGAIYAANVDLRADSKTFKQSFAVELSSDIRRMRHIHDRLAHGFQTPTAGVEVSCQMSEFYAPECTRGVRWNDAAFGICRPLEAAMIPERGRSYPDFMA